MKEASDNKMFIYPLISSLYINDIFSKLKNYKARILVYHGVTKQAPGVFNWQQITEGQFIEQMKYLRKHYNVVPLAVILEHVILKKRFPKGCVALTFDDGYENNFSLVYPLLKEFNLPATFFISTAFVGNGTKSLWFDTIYNGIAKYRGSEIDLSPCGFGIADTSTPSAKSQATDWLCNELKTLSYTEMQDRLQCILNKVEMNGQNCIPFPGLSWEQIRILAKDPLFTIGGHSHTHPILTKLPEEQAWKEIIINKELLEENIGKRVTIFSYPNGNWDASLVSLLKRAGYEFALTSEENFVTSNPYAVERITARNPSSIYLFEGLVSGLIPVTKRCLSFLKEQPASISE